MKVGDSLYCYNNGNEWAKNLFNVGRYYVITEVTSDRFYIICDNFFLATYFYFEQIYSLDDDTICRYYYWRLYFRTLREVRKEKLDILGKSSLIERSSICEAIIGTEGLE